MGVAFETLTDAQNIGYIIPVPVLQHFLDDLDKNSVYTGFPGPSPFAACCASYLIFARICFSVTGFTFQTLENPSMRHFLKIPEEQHGLQM